LDLRGVDEPPKEAIVDIGWRPQNHLNEHPPASHIPSGHNPLIADGADIDETKPRVTAAHSDGSEMKCAHEVDGGPHRVNAQKDTVSEARDEHLKDTSEDRPIASEVLVDRQREGRMRLILLCEHPATLGPLPNGHDRRDRT